MNEKKRTILLFLIALVVIGLIVLGSFFEEIKSNRYLKDFHNDLNSSSNKLVMIGRDNCSWCQLFHPILDFASEHYGFEFNYINTNELTNATFKKLLKDIDVDSKDFGTPLTLVVREGKVIDSLSGYSDEPKLLGFLKDNGFVDASAKTVLNYIDFNEYKDVIKSKNKSIVVIGQTTCGYCIKAKPILDKVAVDYNLKINFININELSEEDSKEFQETLSYYNENDWGTPLTLIVKKGEVIADANGLLDYDGYVKLFTENGLIK